MENNHKKLSLSIKLCWLLLIIFWLICFISGEKLNVFIHSEKLIAFGEFIDKYEILRNGTALILYYFNMLLIVYTILKKKLFSSNALTISLFIVLVWVIKINFRDYEFSSYLDFSYIILAIILDRRKLLRSISILILCFIFSLLTMGVKQYNNILVEDLPTIISSTMMIDYYFIVVAYYLRSRKEENQDETMGNVFQFTKKVEDYKRCIGNFISGCRSNYRSFISYLKTNKWQIYCSIIFCIITSGSILIIGYFLNRMIEAAISIICFHLFRHYDSKTYHASTSIKCFIVSTIDFSIISRTSLPIHQSLFCAIFLAYILTKIMYYTKDYIDYKYQEKLDVEIKPIEKLTETEFYELFDVKFHHQDLKVVYLYIHKKRDTSVDKLALSHNLSRSTLYRLVKRVYKYYNELLNK